MATFGEKLGLFRGLITGERAFVGPFYACVEITERCNLKCPACRFHSIKPAGQDRPGGSKKDCAPDMPIEFFSKVCGELKGMNTTTVTITGEGEPLLHPELPRLIGIAKGAGLRVTMTTNGTLLNEKNVRALIEKRLDHLKVSLWAGTRQEYVKNYPGTNPEYFDRIVQGLKLLSAHKKRTGSTLPRVVLHHPCTPLNHTKLDDIIEVARQSGCDELTFSAVKVWGEPMKELDLSAEQIASLCRSFEKSRGRLDALSIDHNIDEMLMRYRLGKNVGDKLPCFVSWLYTRIKLDGSVYSCHNCSVPMGGLKTETLASIWNGKGYRAFRRTTLTCEGLRSLAGICKCDYCGQTEENMSVHRIFKWLSPLVGRDGGRGEEYLLGMKRIGDI